MASYAIRSALAWLIGLSLFAVSFAARLQSTNNMEVEAKSDVQSALAAFTSGLETFVFEEPTMHADESFSYNTSYLRKSFQPDDTWRDAVRDHTRDQVANMFGFKGFHNFVRAPYKASYIKAVPSFRKRVHLFRDVSSHANPTSTEAAGGRFLLGRYDVLCGIACADYDFRWQQIGKGNSFWIAHAAALNVGESIRSAYDFRDFSDRDKQFDQAKYTQAMGRIVRLIMQAARSLHVKDFVFFPFGMGAFLRNLKALDTRYAEESQMQGLREELAREFVAAFMSTPEIRIHLCLAFTPAQERYVNVEMLGNTAAFLSAIREVTSSERRDSEWKPVVWPDADSMQVAHELAGATSETMPTVMLANGANRKKIGNHWYSNGAKRAIDENLHRRSVSMSAMSYLANKGFENPDDRKADDLSKQVEAMGGSVLHWDPVHGLKNATRVSRNKKRGEVVEAVKALKSGEALEWAKQQYKSKWKRPKAP